MANALNHFFLQPVRLRNLGLGKFRLAQLLHERTNGAFDEVYLRWAKLTRPMQTLPEPRWLSAPNVDLAVSELKEQGSSVLPKRLSTEAICEIFDFAFSVPAYAKSPGERIAIRKGSIPQDFGRYMWNIRDIVQLPAVQNLVSDSTLHRIAQSYLGARPLLSSISLWLDPPYPGTFVPHVYHYDNDGPGFLKIFFYLTDVEEDTGAHRCIRRTHGHRKPGPFRLSMHYDEETLLSFFGRDNEVVFTGPAGTVLAEDTSGFHRGSTVKRDFRLLMQFQYTLLDMPHEQELLGPLRPAPICLDPSIAPIVRKFFVPA